MRTPKFIITISTFLVLSNSLFAGTPLSGTASDFVKIKLLQLTKYIELTNNQKRIVEVKANVFALKIINKDSIDYYTALPQAAKDYKVAIDSILTIEQKEQIVQKQTGRREAAINRYKTKK